MKKGIIALLLALALLSGCGYNDADMVPETEQTPQAAKTVAELPSPSPDIKPAKKESEKAISPSTTPKAVEEAPAPEASVAPEPVTTCTLSVTCRSLLDNMDKLKEEKRQLVPPDGVIFAAQTVEFGEGESVFDILLREMQENKIHFEFTKTPMYDSAYIEGIGNLYEFDCGNLSGWMYRVNDISPTYGCSQYEVKEGDRIEFYYSCNLFEG